MSAQSAGQIFLDLVLNQQGFTRQLGGVMGIAKKAAGVLAGVFSIGAVTAFTKSCLELGSDLNEVQNVVDVTFGGMSSKVNEWAKNAMTDFGLSEKCAKDYVGTLGAMSKAFGFGTEKAYEQATALAGLSADVASFYNLTTDDAFTKLKAVYTGETEGLKSLGVVMTQAALDEYALAKGWGKVTAKMTEAEKVELRLAFVTDSLSGAAGDFARTSDSWANQTRVLSLRFDALKASLGQGFINILTPVIRMLNELVARLLVAAEAFRDFTEAVFGDAGGSQTEQTADSAGLLAENTESAAAAAKAYKKSLIGIDTLNRLGEGADSDTGGASASENAGAEGSDAKDDSADKAKKMSGLLDRIKKKFREIADMTGLTDFWKGFTDGFSEINFGEIKENLEGIFGSIRDIAGNCFGNVMELVKKFLGFVGTNWGRFAQVIGKGIELATGFIDSFLNANGGRIEEFINKTVSVCSEYIDMFSAVIDGFFSDTAAWWEERGKPVWDGLVRVFNDICGVALDVINNNILPLFDTLAKALEELWENNIRPLWDSVLNCLSSIGNMIISLWDNILKPVVDWWTENVAPRLQKFVEIAISVFQTVVGVVVDTVKSVIDWFGGLADFLTGVFTLDWEKACTGLEEMNRALWDGILAAGKGAINLLIDAVNFLWNGILEVIQGVGNGIGGIVGALGKALGKEDWGWEINLSDVQMIPKLATGGYVAANTPRLAVVGDNRHEGEIIAPESKIAEAVAAGIAAAMPQMQGVGGEIVIPLTLELDGDVLGAATVKYQARELMKGNGA